MERLKRLRRITMMICGLLLLVSLLLLDRFGGPALPVFFVVMIAAFVLDWLLAKRIRQGQEEWQRSQPVHTEWATVVRRRVAHGYRAGRNGVHSTRDNWCITFQTDRSGELEMVVPRDVYLAVTEGKRGLLKHKGKQFHSFT